MKTVLVTGVCGGMEAVEIASDQSLLEPTLEAMRVVPWIPFISDIDKRLHVLIKHLSFRMLTT